MFCKRMGRNVCLVVIFLAFVMIFYSALCVFMTYIFFVFLHIITAF